MKKLLIVLALASSLFSAELTIASPDGFKLYGWLEKPKNAKKATPIILFAHQFGADHAMWNSIAKEFNDKGFATLSVDLRGHGKSISQNDKENKVVTDARMDHIKEALVQSDKKVGFANIPQDLRAWLELVGEDDSIDMENLYLFGSSLGGGCVIPLLSDYDVKALVTLSAGGLQALADDTEIALSTSMTKELFIAAKNDPLGAAKRSLDYTQKSISGTALIISGNGHGGVLLPQVKHFIFSFIANVK
jgi:alpha-beta hydrolase superfamily lysophospholipase